MTLFVGFPTIMTMLVVLTAANSEINQAGGSTPATAVYCTACTRNTVMDTDKKHK